MRNISDLQSLLEGGQRFAEEELDAEGTVVATAFVVTPLDTHVLRMAAQHDSKTAFLRAVRLYAKTRGAVAVCLVAEVGYETHSLRDGVLSPIPTSQGDGILVCAYGIGGVRACALARLSNRAISDWCYIQADEITGEFSDLGISGAQILN